jgi:prepilin-type N-terminal cleavage/methylation domain-containing protein
VITPRSRDRGLTIVELLVTLAVASVVSAATFVFFAGQQRIYEVQGDVLNVQQNLWASIETLARYGRAAGSGMTGCVRPDPDGAGADTGDPVPGGAASPATGLRVWQNGTFSRVPPLWIQNGASGAPDRITVAFGDGASGAYMDTNLAADIAAGQSTANAVLRVGMTASFRANEFALLVDRGQPNLDAGCMLFQITSIDAATDSLIHSGAVSTWNTLPNVGSMVPFTFDGDADPMVATAGVRGFGQLTYVQFAIDSAVNPPTLTMNVLTGTQGPQVLAEGIEDLQIAYACDLQPVAAPDGVLTEGTTPSGRLADEWVYNEPGDVPPIGCKRAEAIRITLMARSVAADSSMSGLTSNAKAAAEDGAAGSNDQFRHRVASVIVYPRN